MSVSLLTQSRSITDAARSDPVGAGIVVCVVLLLALGLGTALPQLDVELPTLRVPALLWEPHKALRPLERPPQAWLASAAPGDVLRVPGRRVDYWGAPRAAYGVRATEEASQPRAIIVHYNDAEPILQLVRYQHEGDHARGGAYGYHVYIDPAGHIVQGAPLSRRTNHIKPAGHYSRTRVGAGLWNGNTVSVSLVGACRSPPHSAFTYRCTSETVTKEQMEAGLAAVDALRQRFGIACTAVYGHGELQNDRHPFEGSTLASAARHECAAPAPALMAGR